MGRERRAVSQELTKVSDAVAQWRAEGGGRGSKIPDDLWNEAVRVARVEGVWRTAKALRFRYERLKERIEGADGGDGSHVPADPVLAGETQPVEAARARGRRAGRPRRWGKKASGGEVAPTNGAASAKLNGHSGFIALEMGPPADGRTVIELHGRQGDRMRVEAPGGVDVCGLVEKFWSRTR
jgi:hypothetical protein